MSHCDVDMNKATLKGYTREQLDAASELIFVSEVRNRQN